VGPLVIEMADYGLRLRLIGSRTEMNSFFAFFSALGGVAVFGFLGIVLGPVLVAVGLAMVQIYAGSRSEAPA